MWLVGTLVGVSICVTTVPAVGTIALCLDAGVWSEVGWVAARLGINMTAMVISGTLACSCNGSSGRGSGAPVKQVRSEPRSP